MRLFHFVKQLLKAQPRRDDDRRNRFAPRAEALESREVPATFLVLNTGSGFGSLRQAIMNANANPGADVIQWVLPVGSGVTVIQPGLGGLPAITDSVDIQGPTNAAGRPLVVLDGILAGQGVIGGGGIDGLRFTGGPSQVRNLVIQRFSGDGIELGGAGGHVVQGCFIGTDSTGTMDRGNGENGVFANSSDNLVGGCGAAERNVISGNTGAGVRILGWDNFVDGNFIGTDVTGTMAVPNQTGIVIQTGWNNVVGRPPCPNVISGNLGNGVEILGSQAPSSLYQDNGNIIWQNFIGTNAAGTAALGNGGNGVLIRDSNFTHVGNGGTGNNIAGNGLDGVVIEGVTSVRNWVANNYIGIRPDGGTSGHGGHGVHITGLASNNRVGDGAGYGNQIAFSGGDGVFVESGARNRILNNDFLSNAGLPIDLGPNGANANDSLDSDGGANNLQNKPTITGITFNAATGRFIVSWSLNTTANTSGITIEFFRSSAGSPGLQRAVRTVNTTPTGAPLRTNAAGNVSGTVELTLMPGDFLAVSATGPDGTSELASTVMVP